MSSDPYLLAEVLAVAKNHPFYVPEVNYPPDATALKKIQDCAKQKIERANLSSQKLLRKKDLFVLRLKITYILV